MNNQPILKSNRLTLRSASAKDIPTIIKYANNPKISEMLLTLPYPYEEKDAIFWINMAQQGFHNKDKYIFGIYSTKTTKFMGGIGLHLNKRDNRGEVGYWIGEPFWNKGYMTEALSLILQFGFEQLGLHKVYASHLDINPSSGRVMIKNGMKQEATLIDEVKKGEIYHNLTQYYILSGTD